MFNQDAQEVTRTGLGEIREPRPDAGWAKIQLYQPAHRICRNVRCDLHRAFSYAEDTMP